MSTRKQHRTRGSKNSVRYSSQNHLRTTKQSMALMHPAPMRRRLPAGLQFAKAVARTALWGSDGNTPTGWAAATETTLDLLPWLNAYSRCHRGVALTPKKLRNIARTTTRKLDQHRTGLGLSPVRTAYWLAARELLSSGKSRTEEEAAWLVREMWVRNLASGQPVAALAGESHFLAEDEREGDDLVELLPESYNQAEPDSVDA